MTGPSWLAIGAQRCGTTWFADLLTRHPDVGLSRDGRREGQFFDPFLVRTWEESDGHRFRARFDPSKRSGESTPACLRCLWVPALARRACPEDVVLLVLLRDPVERFHSAMRWFADRRDAPPSLAAGADPPAPRSDAERRLLRWVRDKGNDAVWGGMYATQLDAWAAEFPRERFVVLQYEAVAADPQAAADRVFAALGLLSVPLGSTSGTAWNATDDRPAPEPWRETPGLGERLRAVYAPEVARLTAWGIDPSLWPHFR